MACCFGVSVPTERISPGTPDTFSTSRAAPATFGAIAPPHFFFTYTVAPIGRFFGLPLIRAFSAALRGSLRMAR